MKKFSTLLLLFVLFSSARLNAQAPVNDDCAGLIDLGYAPTCPTDTFSNVGATNSDIGFDNQPTCFNGNLATRDVWFAFTVPDTLLSFRVTLTGVGANSIQNPQVAIYRGDCTFDGLAQFDCQIASSGNTSLFIDLADLSPDVTYYIRVSDWSPSAAPNSGNFTLCVAPIPPIINIDEGGSTLCQGTVYDSGGPDDDYGPGEDHTFVICPSTASACITFTLEYYNIEGEDDFFGFPGPDFLAFHDGNSLASPVIAQISGFNGGNSTVGWGGVAFQVQSTSGCLTLHFVSDSTLNFEGFKGTWECSTQNCPPLADLAVDTLVNADTIIAALATPASTITITKIDCPSGAIGTFFIAPDNNDLGLSKGLLLTTGNATLALGPNSMSNAGVDLGAPGDADLDSLSIQFGNGTLSNDACIVELDVFVATDELTFEYVFGSEEYPEYVNSQFNDIFAFLVSGPGISGDPGLGIAKNIAVLPDGITPVQINSVNQLLNWQYFRNNELGQSLQYDGLTSDSLGIKRSLTARTTTLPCNTYHLKLAIADRQDGAFDSGVFISEIRGGTPNLAVQFASGIDYLVENCSGTQDSLIISLSDPQLDTVNFNTSIGGTATLGTDYTLAIPGVISFLPGQTRLAFPLTPIVDALLEGSETITVTLSNNFGCGTVVYKTITIDLNDNVLVEVIGGDTILACKGATVQLQATGAVDYFWSPPGAVNNPNIANPIIANIQNDVVLRVQGTLSTCTDEDTVFVRVLDPVIDVVALSPTNICQGDSVLLQVINNVGNSGLTWIPSIELSDPSSATPVAKPSSTRTYRAEISIAGCTLSDSVTINVDTLFYPQMLVPDTIVCQNYPVQLAEVINSSTNYQWSPPTGLSDPTSSGPIALPDQSTTYILIATSANGYCSKSDSINLTVVPANIDILGDDYREICLGETVDLTAVATPQSTSPIIWSPPFYVTNPTGPNTSTTPDESITIFANYTVNNCPVVDSVVIRVDSLPNQALRLEKFKPIYCPGDTVFLLSPTYEPANFPDIVINWESFAGLLTPVENWNLVINATVTHTFRRFIENNACSDTSSIEVPVGIIPMVMITATPDSICFGQSTQLNVTVDPVGEKIEWEASSGVPCANCLNPTVTPSSSGSVTYSLKTPDADCPANASVSVQVLPPPALLLPQNPTICLDSSIMLNGTSQAGVQYSWTSNPPGFTSSDARPVVTPSATTTFFVTAVGPRCSNQSSTTVSIVSAEVNAGVDQIYCLGQPVNLSATVTGTAPNPAFVWQPGGLPAQSVSVTPSGDVNFVVQLTYGPNCFDTDTVLLTQGAGVGNLDLEIIPDQDTFCEGTFVTIRLVEPEPGIAYSWFEDGNPLNLTGDSIRIVPAISAPGTVTYTVRASSVDCTEENQITINLVDCLEMPTAFTPNGDNINETFTYAFVGDGEVDVISFDIFSRWGDKVYSGSGPQAAWDGKVQGKLSPSDVYFYVIKVQYPSGREAMLRGEVTLLR